MQNVGPGLAAVISAENAALRAGGSAHRGDNHNIGIFGIDDNLRDLGGALEAGVYPGFATIGGLVYPIAIGASARAGYDVATTCVNNVGIRRSDLDGADAINASHLVEYRIPSHTTAGGFPDATLRQTNVKCAGLADHAIDRRDASAVIRSDVAPLQTGKQIRADLRCRDHCEAERKN